MKNCKAKCTSRSSLVPKPVLPQWEIYWRSASGCGVMRMYPCQAADEEAALEIFRKWAKGIGSYYDPGVEFWCCPAPKLYGVICDKGDRLQKR